MSLLMLMSVVDWTFLGLGNPLNKSSTCFAEHPFLASHDLDVCVCGGSRAAAVQAQLE